MMDPSYDPVLLGFSKAVIAAQPGDYAASIGREILPYFLPWQDLGPENRALAEHWVIPASLHDPNAPMLTGPGFYDPEPADPGQAPGVTALTRTLHWYGLYLRTPALLSTAALILAAVAFVRLRRREQWGAARDAGMVVLLATAFVVAQVAFGMYDARYGLPSLPLFTVGAVLAGHALRSAQRDRQNGTAAA
jgi:hypothetical protein